MSEAEKSIQDMSFTDFLKENEFAKQTSVEPENSLIQGFNDFLQEMNEGIDNHYDSFSEREEAIPEIEIPEFDIEKENDAFNPETEQDEFDKFFEINTVGKEFGLSDGEGEDIPDGFPEDYPDGFPDDIPDELPIQIPTDIPDDFAEPDIPEPDIPEPDFPEPSEETPAPVEKPASAPTSEPAPAPTSEPAPADEPAKAEPDNTKSKANENKPAPKEEAAKPVEPKNVPEERTPENDRMSEAFNSAIEKRRKAKQAEREERLKRARREAERKKTIPPKPKFEMQRQMQNDLRRQFMENKITRNIDDIVMSVSTFTENKKDITEKAIEEIRNEGKKNAAEAKLGNEPKALPDTSAVRASDTAKAKSDNSNMPVPVSESVPVVADAPKESGEKSNDDIPDKENTGNAEFEAKKIPHLREYKKGKAPVDKPRFAKPKELGGEITKSIVLSGIISIAVGIFLGVKANSYYNFADGKVNGALQCIFKGFLTENMPTSILPFNPSIFFTSFLLGFGLIAVIAFFKITDKQTKEKRREGHEHGNARLGDKKDFIEYKKKFMDMSLKGK